MFEYVKGEKMHMVAHDTKQIIVFSDRFLIVFKNLSDVPNFNYWFSNLKKIAGLCKWLFKVLYEKKYNTKQL